MDRTTQEEIQVPTDVCITTKVNNVKESVFNKEVKLNKSFYLK